MAILFGFGRMVINYNCNCDYDAIDKFENKRNVCFSKEHEVEKIWEECVYKGNLEKKRRECTSKESKYK